MEYFNTIITAPAAPICTNLCKRPSLLLWEAQQKPQHVECERNDTDPDVFYHINRVPIGSGLLKYL